MKSIGSHDQRATKVTYSHDALEHWKTELWQILRMHHNTTKCVIDFGPDWGVPLWSLQITYTKKGETITLVSTHGVHLWKRMKKATEVLKEFFGKKAYVYEF